MPYFSVEFGLDDGYAHIIENSEAFPPYFAKVFSNNFLFLFFFIIYLCIFNKKKKEIIGGILDMDDPLFWRRPKKDHDE